MVLSKKSLGEKIKEARKLKSKLIGKRYTGDMLANDIKISRSYLGDIEAGRTYPNYVLLNKIAEACGVPFSYFGDIDKELEGFVNKVRSDATLEQKNDTLKLIKSDDFNLEILNEIPKPNFLVENHSIKETPLQYKTSENQNVTDIKQAMELILSQPGLMLNGEMLSDESKIALANAIKMGLAYAAQMQEKEKKNTKEK